MLENLFTFCWISVNNFISRSGNVLGNQGLLAQKKREWTASKQKKGKGQEWVNVHLVCHRVLHV